jgi:hypothetical protein
VESGKIRQETSSIVVINHVLYRDGPNASIAGSIVVPARCPALVVVVVVVVVVVTIAIISLIVV